MSLLLDALRKAEQQKQLAGRQQAPAASVAGKPAGNIELELVPHGPDEASPPGAAGRESLPELPARLEELDEQFIAHAAQPQRPTARSTGETAAAAPPKPSAGQAANGSDAARSGARLMFEAKLPQKKNARFALFAGTFGLIAAAGIGAYVWWEMQPKGGLAVGAGLPVTPPAAPIKPAAPPPAAPLAASPPAALAAAPPPAAPVAVSPQPTFSGAPTAQRASGPATEQEPTETPAKQAPARPAPASAPTQLSPIHVSKAVQKVDPLLEQAHQAYERGELETARKAWEKVLTTDPYSADALHGMAALALQRQQPDEAASYYLRALDADPKDAIAIAGLLGLKAPADPHAAESRLKLLLTERPDSPHLNFALGNLMARQGRWADAQQAFFKAHTADPTNPDYLFNLAVSLDQMHQPRLAVQYYNQAVAAAARQPAGFDAARAAARAKELQSDQP